VVLWEQINNSVYGQNVKRDSNLYLIVGGLPLKRRRHNVTVDTKGDSSRFPSEPEKFPLSPFAKALPSGDDMGRVGSPCPSGSHRHSPVGTVFFFKIAALSRTCQMNLGKNAVRRRLQLKVA
jgi:hypothetical protein